MNNQDTNGVRGKLLAKIGPKLTALLTLDGTVDHSGTDYYTPKRPIIGGTLKTPVYGLFSAADTYASQGPKNDSWSAGVSLKLSYALDPHVTLNSITAVRGFAQDPVNYNSDGQPLVAYSPTDPVLVSRQMMIQAAAASLGRYAFGWQTTTSIVMDAPHLSRSGSSW